MSAAERQRKRRGDPHLVIGVARREAADALERLLG